MDYEDNEYYSYQDAQDDIALAELSPQTLEQLVLLVAVSVNIDDLLQKLFII